MLLPTSVQKASLNGDFDRNFTKFRGNVNAQLRAGKSRSVAHTSTLSPRSPEISPQSRQAQPLEEEFTPELSLAFAFEQVSSEIRSPLEVLSSSLCTFPHTP